MGKEHLIAIGIPEYVAEIIMGEREAELFSDIVRVYEYSRGSVRFEALAKADEMIDSFDKAVWLYDNSTGELKEKALFLAEELIVTLSNALWVYKHSVDCIQFKAFAEVDSRVKSFIDAKRVHSDSAGCPELQKMALLKAGKFMKTLEDAVWVNNNYTDSELGDIVFEFIKEL